MRKKLFKSRRKYVSSKRWRWLRIKNHPIMVPIVTMTVLLTFTALIFVLVNGQTVGPADAHIVLLNNDGKRQTIPTRAANVGQLLKNLKIKLKKGDVVEPTSDTEIVEDNFRVNVYRAKPVTLVDGLHRTFLYSAASTPRSIASEAGLKVYAEDKISFEIPDNFLHSGSVGREVHVDRATLAYLNLYGTPVAVRTHSLSVGELLTEEKVILGPSDSVKPKLGTRIKNGISIIVARKGIKVVSVTETIPPPTKVIEDNSLSFGTTVVRQKGSPGKRLVTYQILTKNGKEVGRKKLQEIIAEKPVEEIVARGKAVYIPKDKSAIMKQAGIASSDYAYVNFVISHESGWCPTKVQGQVGYCPPYAPSSIPTNLGYGLGQATPGNKMSSFGSDWKSNPVTQLRWAITYAKGRYGSWQGAYNFWTSHHYW